jgi:hypothetical protein
VTIKAGSGEFSSEYLKVKLTWSCGGGSTKIILEIIFRLLSFLE